MPSEGRIMIRKISGGKIWVVHTVVRITRPLQARLTSLKYKHAPFCIT
jgi:hypothetical protein